MPGLMEGGLLGLIINGMQNRKLGLPFLATKEERVENYKQRMELFKEQQKQQISEADQLAAEGRTSILNQLLPQLQKSGAIDTTTAGAKWLRSEEQAKELGPGRAVRQGLMGLLSGAFKGEQQQKTTSAPVSVPSSSNTPTTTPPPSNGLPSTPEEIPHFAAFKAAAEKYNVPLSTVLGLAHAESDGFSPDVVNGTRKSKTGVQGIMQVTKDATQLVGNNPDERHLPESSIDSGVKYLRYLADKQGVDLNNPESVVMGYTTPAGGANSKYINKVANLTEHYKKVVGEGTTPATTTVEPSPFPLVQRFPEMGRLPPMQQAVLDNTARTLKVTTGIDGKLSLSFNPLATPTVDEQTATLLSTLPPDQRQGLLMSMLAVKMGKGEINNFGVNNITGERVLTIHDPLTNQTKTISLGKVESTPTEKSALEVQTAGEKAKATAIGQEAGAREISPQMIARENVEQSTRMKDSNKDFVKDVGDTIGSARRLGKGFQALTNFAGLTPSGEINMANIPTGLFESTLQEFAKRGISQSVTGVMRERLSSMNGEIKQIMYTIGGKQLSDTELKALEALDQSISLSPAIYVTRFADVMDLLKEKAEGRKAAMVAEKYDTRALDKLISTIDGIDITKNLPKEIRDIVNPSNKIEDAARKLYDEMKGK